MNWSSVFFAAMTAFLFSTTVQAIPHQQVHASACIPAEDSGGILSRTEYRITNVGTAPVTVFCPVIVDFQEVLDGGIFVTVRVFDQHPTENVDCTLSIRDQTGNRMASTSRSSYYKWNNEHEELLLFLFTRHWNTSPEIGAAASGVSLQCTLPPNDGNYYTKMFSYRVATQ